jgi:hypothetical protein
VRTSRLGTVPTVNRGCDIYEDAGARRLGTMTHGR